MPVSPLVCQFVDRLNVPLYGLYRQVHGFDPPLQAHGLCENDETFCLAYVFR